MKKNISFRNTTSLNPEISNRFPGVFKKDFRLNQKGLSYLNYNSYYSTISSHFLLDLHFSPKKKHLRSAKIIFPGIKKNSSEY